MLSIMGKWKYSHTQKPHDFTQRKAVLTVLMQIFAG